MKYIREFRDPSLAKELIKEIRRECNGATYRIMEICGGHTHAFYRFGLVDLLHPHIELLHGPGCPVCVLPTGRLDQAIALSQQDTVLLATYGDMIRVPGTMGSLATAAATGSDVRIVYSPIDALRLAEAHPDKKVVFFAIGFETTAPATAVTLLHARERSVRNFFVFCNHVRLIPAMRALLDSPQTVLDGFIGPGHVSTVIGAVAWEGIVKDYGKGVVISGFEPLDLLQAVWMLVRQLKSGQPRVEVQYTRSVRYNGNPVALSLMDQVFEVRETFEWRGLGWIPDSGFKIAAHLSDWDAEVQFSIQEMPSREPKGCLCGDVLRGVKKPWECPLFDNPCSPERPIGACMVSSEGACAAVYHHARHSHFVRRKLSKTSR
ncbi:MAG: hydrogenase formation protein HypD [Armatimonadetes bacterium]|nr:hydrogenase formation protein HypD [Armatimonadota bacterium]MDW8122400.1 hydrogenase formation protein HypD [Armatimonadota bacterium]